MRWVRALVALAGIVLAATGVYKVVGEGGSTIVETLKWFVVGTVAHDLLLAPIVLLIGVLAVRAAPAWARMPIVTGFVVLGTATVVAFPMLSAFGATSTNPTLLDRDYIGGWWVLAGLTALAVLAGCWWQRRAVGGSSPASRPPASSPGGVRAREGRTDPPGTSV